MMLCREKVSVWALSGEQWGVYSYVHRIIDKAQSCGFLMPRSQGVHYSSSVNIHVRAQKGYYLEQACTNCTYKRHIAIKQEVDIHEAGDKALEKYM